MERLKKRENNFLTQPLVHTENFYICKHYTFVFKLLRTFKQIQQTKDLNTFAISVTVIYSNKGKLFFKKKHISA